MLVLDSSAAVAMTFERPFGEKIRGLMSRDEKVIAPELYLAEMAHVVEKYVRGGYIDAPTGVTLLGKATNLVDELIPMSSLAQEVLSESLRLGHSSCDLFYLVLARRNAATLCTLDRRLQGLCLKNGVSCVCGIDVEGEPWTVRAESEAGAVGRGGMAHGAFENAVATKKSGE